MIYYYALFKESKKKIEVEFPDLQGCLTFGDNWDEAIGNATDALAGWLANVEPKFVKKPSLYNELKKIIKQGILIPIAVDDKTLKRYRELYVDSKKYVRTSRKNNVSVLKEKNPKYKT